MSQEPRDIKVIFSEALEKQTDNERSAYLTEVCGNNANLREKVEKLLRAHNEAGDFLEAPLFDAEVGLDIPLAEVAGTVIGRYKLLEKIGEGGMAVVYMAEQTEPIRRKVALKIIKLGMDTKSVIARFEAERQALAMMDHPNIAKVLDAGATETGRPYFVMELVKGVSITDYCDANSLSTKERLELFIQVCNAVQHAHQKGIIHRDIKPTNVMVTLHDGKSVPKVIDFGIAKAINQKLTEKTLFTRYAHIIGTPAYMSPEQAELSDLDVDTRTDIYSLGVLLYELLTGTTPFGEEELRKAGYIEMQRVIREQEPVKPSTRIRTAQRSMGVPPARVEGVSPSMRGPEALDTRGQDGRDTMGKMPMLREVRGDLDWIVMKSLEKDRTRRYETADALARDVQRYLSHEPVEACPPSATYRLRKFVRRNKTVATAVAAVAASLVIGVSIATWQAIRATKAEGVAKQQEQLALREKKAVEEAAERERALRTEAEGQRARAEANSRLALEALEEVYIGVMQRRGPQGTQLKNEEEAFLHSVFKFYECFADASRAVSQTGGLVGEMQGKVLAIRRELVRQSPHVVGYHRALAAATVGLASLLEKAGRTGEAEETYEQAVYAQEELVDRFPTVAEYRAELAATHDRLTNLLLASGKNDHAEKKRAMAETVRSAAESATQSKQTAPIRFNRFTDPASLHLCGDAALVNDRLRLTRPDLHRAGAAWTAEKQLVAFGFDTVFTFRLSGGADGFAFVVQNHGPAPLGPCGSAQGYGDAFDTVGYSSDNVRGIPNSLAVEFDTFMNRGNYDLAGDHISVQTNGMGVNSVHHAFSLAAVAAPVNLDDGNVHQVRVRYVPGTLTIFMDRSAEPTLTAPVELSAALQLDRGRAWAGFTAGTGEVWQTHDILSWEYRPLVDEDTADSFFRRYPAMARDPNQPAVATAEQEWRSVGETAPAPEDFPFLRKAAGFYQAFAEQNRDDLNSRWEIGKAWWRIGEIRTALGDGNKAELARERSEQAYQTAMSIWQTLDGDLPADAETGLQVALAYGRHAQACYEREEFEKALQYYHRAIQLDGGNAAFYNSLAWALAVCPDPEFRNPQQAVDLAAKAVKLQSGAADAWNTLGVAQYRAGQWEAAIESLHQSDAREQNTGSSFNGFFLAMAYWQIGKQDEARTWYDKAVSWMDKNQPRDEELLRFRAEATELLGIIERR